jgi:uncharacterized protein
MKPLLSPITFNWEHGNKDKNWIKHQVDVKESEEVFFNKPLILMEDIVHSQKEDRLIALGKSNHSRHLYLVFTIRDEVIRIISARDQSKKERKYYEKFNQS